MPKGTKIVYQDHATDLLDLAIHLISGVIFLHDQGIAHLDIKRENLLLSSAGKLSIIDFSISQLVELDTTFTGFWGTQGCVAPEIEKGKPFSPLLADRWACGKVLRDMARECSGSLFAQAITLQAKYLTRTNPTMRLPLHLVRNALEALHQLATYRVQPNSNTFMVNFRKRRLYASHDSVGFQEIMV